METSVKKRNLKIELIRIIACFSVLWYHIRRLPWKVDGSLSETAVFFECVCTICVMTFFLITGFYIYDRENSIIHDWFSLIKGFFKKVFPVFLIAVIVSLIFHDYFISTKTIGECILNIDIIYIITSILTSFLHLSVNNLPGTCGHLWYVYAYFFIILYYPLTRWFLKCLDKRIRNSILILVLLLMIANDYLLFFDNPILNFPFEIIKKPVIYSAYGHIIYHEIIERYLNKFNFKIFILSIIVYIITFVCLFKTQIAYDLGTNGDYVYTAWLSTYSLILTTSFILFVYNIDISRFYGTIVEKTIYYISSISLDIYIVHYFIITKLLTLAFQNIFFDNLKYFIQHLLYHIFYSLFIFIVSVAFIVLKNKVVTFVSTISRRLIWKKEKTI